MFGKTRPPSQTVPEMISRLQEDSQRLARVKVEDFKDAWLDAEIEVVVSYDEYDKAPKGDRAGLWQRYLAALDREQQAAKAYQVAVGY